MRVFLMAVSLRKGSHNKKLIRVVADLLSRYKDHEVDLCEFNEFPMPLFDEDLEEKIGIPEAVIKLAEKFQAADAIVISSPEYNGSMPGTFKNAIDWLARIKPVPIKNKHICLIGASKDAYGAHWGSLHSRVPLTNLEAYVYPTFFGVPNADKAFDQSEKLKDPQQFEDLKKLITNFLHYSDRKETPFEILENFLDEKEKLQNDFRPPHSH